MPWERQRSSVLAERLSAGEVDTTAISEKSGQREKLNAALFGAIRIHHLFRAEEIDGADRAELFLWASPCLDEAHWYASFSDDLRQRRRIVWSKLLVSKADIARWWPKAKPISRPRGPGRPSDRELVIAEFKQRCESGETLPTLAAEARTLSEWLEHNHDDAILTAPTTIENNIRDAYRAFQKAHEKK